MLDGIVLGHLPGFEFDLAGLVFNLPGLVLDWLLN
jgi:hypothetical protein